MRSDHSALVTSLTRDTLIGGFRSSESTCALQDKLEEGRHAAIPSKPLPANGRTYLCALFARRTTKKVQKRGGIPPLSTEVLSQQRRMSCGRAHARVDA